MPRTNNSNSLEIWKKCVKKTKRSRGDTFQFGIIKTRTLNSALKCYCAVLQK